MRSVKLRLSAPSKYLLVGLWLLSASLLPRPVLAAPDTQEAEIIRLRGFAEHQSDEIEFEKQRVRGETEYLEESEQWQKQKDKDLAEHKKRRAAALQVQSDSGKGAREDAEEKRAWDKDYEKSRQAFAKNRDRFDRSKAKGLVTEDEEFGLLADRPRYDYKKRALYGAPLKYGKIGPSTGGGSGSSSPGFSMGNPGGSPAPFGSGNFPPPPSFDDFGDGYIPPPNLGGGFGDDIPPPPPPPMMDDFGGGFNNGGFNNEIPPPPPPPPFMDDGGEF